MDIKKEDKQILESKISQLEEMLQSEKQKLSMAVEALKFYSDVKNWKHSKSGFFSISEIGAIRDSDLTRVTSRDFDSGFFLLGGDKARKTLSIIEKKEEESNELFNRI